MGRYIPIKTEITKNIIKSSLISNPPKAGINNVSIAKYNTAECVNCYTEDVFGQYNYFPGERGCTQ